MLNIFEDKSFFKYFLTGDPVQNLILQDISYYWEIVCYFLYFEFIDNSRMRFLVTGIQYWRSGKRDRYKPVWVNSRAVFQPENQSEQGRRTITEYDIKNTKILGHRSAFWFVSTLFARSSPSHHQLDGKLL